MMPPASLLVISKCVLTAQRVDKERPGRCGRGRLLLRTLNAYCGVTPLAFMAAAHLVISLSTYFCRYAAERRSFATTVVATSRSRACTAGVSSAALSAALSFVTIGSGTPFGKKKPIQ